MDLGFGLNLNSFVSQKGAQPFGQQQPQQGGTEGQSSAASAFAESFGSQLQAQNVSAQGFAGKPLPTPGENAIAPINGFFPTQSVDRIIPQPEDGITGTQTFGNQKVDTLTRRVAWQRFLQKMKSELNVSAEEILLAFQSLTPQELQQPPEKNIDKLVETLGLNPQQSQIANHLFQDLIQKTGSRPLAQELKTSHRDISLSVMSQREQEQRQMSQALEKMNQQFFMKEPQQPERELQGAVVAPPPETAELRTAESSMTTLAPQSAKEFPTLETLQSGKEVDPDLLAQMTPVSEKESAEVLAQSNVQPQQQVNNPSAQIEQTVNSPATEEEGDSLVKAFEKAFTPTTETKPQEKVVAKSGAKNTDLFSKGGESTGYAASVPVENLSNAVADKTTFTEALGGAGATLANKETVSTEDLIQQARMMIREGGGDVKVIMEPEGLGEVAMKVSVDGDKVSVEMVTESDAAKKMLEKGMGDLKAHLHASNLNLESIKVDTASNLGQQLEQQYQDAQRQQAQQFMEQFRQGNQEFKRGFFDLPGAKLYQSQTKAKAPEVDNSGSSRAKEGRRLNLVA